MEPIYRTVVAAILPSFIEYLVQEQLIDQASPHQSTEELLDGYLAHLAGGKTNGAGAAKRPPTKQKGGHPVKGEEGSEKGLEAVKDGASSKKGTEPAEGGVPEKGIELAKEDGPEKGTKAAGGDGEPEKGTEAGEPHCGTDGCEGIPEVGELCPKCTKLQGSTADKPEKEVKAKRGRKPKEDELLDEATGTYRSTEGVKFIKRGTLKIALGKFSKEGTLSPINGRNRAGILKAGFVERLREEHPAAAFAIGMTPPEAALALKGRGPPPADRKDIVTDLVHNLELRKKGDKYTVEEARLAPELRAYCEEQGYLIEKSNKLLPLREGEGLFLLVHDDPKEAPIVIQITDSEKYAVGMYTGLDGLLAEFQPKDREVCDRLGYLVKYDKHILLKLREQPKVEEPPALPSV